MSTRNTSQANKHRGPLLLPILLVVVGGLLLLSNFLLLNSFNVLDLWPLILVILGAQVLLRGDVLSGDAYRTFGITRGSIESATLEINSGEIDVNITSVPADNFERLIAGQYAFRSRPTLDVSDDIHAHINMERSQTPWLAFADWDVALSRELPWQIVMSSYLGQATVNMRDLIVQNALINTGLADIHLTLPYEAFEPIYARSIVGSITVVTPKQANVRITVEGSRFFNVEVDDSRYQEIEKGVYRARNADVDASVVDVIITGTFGDAYLS